MPGAERAFGHRNLAVGAPERRRQDVPGRTEGAEARIGLGSVAENANEPVRRREMLRIRCWLWLHAAERAGENRRAGVEHGERRDRGIVGRGGHRRLDRHAPGVPLREFRRGATRVAEPAARDEIGKGLTSGNGARG